MALPFARAAGPVAVVATGIVAMLVLPHVLDLFALLQITIYAVMAILALSLALVWGGGGILCFGQAAFFGLGAYSYAVSVTDLGDSTYAVLIGIAVPVLFAALLGVLMFVGRLSELYVGVITLCVSLILFNFMNSTSDPRYTIGSAALNGFNGMSAVPTFNMPFDPGTVLSPDQVFYVTVAGLLASYSICRIVMASTYGRVVDAVRQNETRAEMLGYNVAAIKLGIFVIGAGMAGFAGCLYVNWNAFVSPDVFSLATTAQTIVWIIVGGRGTFIGPVLGSVAIQWMSIKLGSGSTINASFLMGLILMFFVVLVPRGTVPTLIAFAARLRVAAAGKHASRTISAGKRA